MKAICIILSTALLFQVQGNSQDRWRVGAKAGISIPKLRAPSKDNNSFSAGYTSVLGPQAGVFGEYKISERFSLQAEFNYNTQGGEKKGDQRLRTKGFESFFPPNAPEYLYARFNNEVKLVYLELPVLAKYSFSLSTNSRLSLLGGVFAANLIKARNISSGKSKVYTDPGYTQEYIPFELDFTNDEDILDRSNQFNYGIQGGLMYGYNLPKVELFVSSGGTYGFKYLQRDPKFGENKTGGITITAGAALKL